MKKVWCDTKVLQDFKTANVFWNIQMSFLFFFFCELLFLQLSFVWSNVYIWGCHLSETFIQCLPRNVAWSIPPASFPNLCSMQWKLRIACLSYAGTWSIKIHVAEELVWVGPAHTDESFCYCCARGWHNKVKLSPLTWSAVSTKSVLEQGIVYKYCRKFRLWLCSVFQTQVSACKVVPFLWRQFWGFPNDQTVVLCVLINM